MNQQMVDRVWRSLSQTADGRIAHHLFQIADGFFIQLARLTQQFAHLFGAPSARGALAAAFMGEEVEQVERCILDVVLVGKYHDSVGPDKCRLQALSRTNTGAASASIIFI